MGDNHTFPSPFIIVLRIESNVRRAKVMAVIFSGTHGRISGLRNPLLKWLKEGQKNSQINCCPCSEACENCKVRVGVALEWAAGAGVVL